MFPCQDPGSRNGGGVFSAFDGVICAENCRITTIEKYEKRIPEAKENFRLAGMEEKITLLEGDAGEILAGLSGSL